MICYEQIRTTTLELKNKTLWLHTSEGAPSPAVYLWSTQSTSWHWHGRGGSSPSWQWSGWCRRCCWRRWRRIPPRCKRPRRGTRRGSARSASSSLQSTNSQVTLGTTGHVWQSTALLRCSGTKLTRYFSKKEVLRHPTHTQNPSHCVFNARVFATILNLYRFFLLPI